MLHIRFKILVILIVLIVFCIPFIYGQKANSLIKIHAEDKSIGAIITEIGAQIGYTIKIADKNLDMTQKITFSMVSSDVRKIMSSLFNNKNVAIKKYGKRMIVYLSKSDIFNTQKTINLPSMNLSGSLIDARTGDTIREGAIFINDNNIAKAVDPKGHFMIAGLTSKDQLTIYSPGYMPQKISVGNTCNIIVNMIPLRMKTDSSTDLSKVINKQINKTQSSLIDSAKTNSDKLVDIGFGSMTAAQTTSAHTTIKGEQLTMNTNAQLSTMLQGLVPGMTVVTQSGQPGLDYGKITIRGLNSINNTDPLVIVDGMETNINNVDVHDVASISVLKDASAAAIYGMRAANGVILITTKRGHKGKTKISYSNSFGWQQAMNMPQYVGAQEYMKLANQMYGMQKYSSHDIAEYDNPYRNKNLYPDTYLIGDLMRTGSGFQQQHSIRANGGNDVLKYALSANLMDQKGLVRNMDRTILRLRFNSDYIISKKLDLMADFSSMNMIRKEPSPDEGLGYGWLLLNSAYAANPLTVNKYSDNKTWGIVNGSYNPVRIAEEGPLKRLNMGIYDTNLKLNYKPVAGLTLTAMAALETTSMKTSKQNFAMRYYLNYPENTVSSIIGHDNMKDLYQLYYFGHYQALANYKRKVKKNSFDATFGFSYLHQNYPATVQLPQKKASTGEVGYNSLFSILGRFHYSYDNRYVIEADVRNDDATHITKDEGFGVFPAISAAWNVSNEKFMHHTSKWLSNLKVRASFGVLGNDVIGYYPYETSELGGMIDPSELLADYENYNMTWETTSTLNFGIDASFFKNTLDASFDIYTKTTSDALLRLPITSAGKSFTYLENAGKIRNNGWDLSLNYHNKIGHDFSYNVGFNFSDVINRLIDVKDNGQITVNSDNIAFGMKKGYPINAYYGYNAIGIYQNQADLQKYLPYSSNVSLGDLIYQKVSGSTEFGDDDMQYIGSNIPRCTYGFNMGGQYKNFDFSLLFQGVGQVDVYTAIMEKAPTSSRSNFLKIHEHAWSENNRNGLFPRISTGDQNYQPSSYWIRSGAYLRLKNLQLGYTLPKKWLKRYLVSKCRFFVSASNVFTLTSLPSYINPEQPDYTRYYPQTRLYSFGINLSF